MNMSTFVLIAHFLCSKMNPQLEGLVNYQFADKTFRFTQNAAAAGKSLQSCPTVQPHRWQPTRLPRPCYSPGKNTGVGCHFLLQCMKVKSESEVAQSYPTLSNPVACSLQGSSVHGIFQARVLEWGAIAFSAYRMRQKLFDKKTLDRPADCGIHKKVSTRQ